MEFPRTIAAIERGISDGDHLGAQLTAWMNGKPAADLAIGELRPGVPMQSDHLLVWMSAGKPITAVAIARLVERGLLDFDDTVARFIPEFAAAGKEPITIRQVLMHTGGFRLVSNNWSPEPWDQIIQRICASKIEPGWVPGQKAGYHVASGWFILGEVLMRLTGRSFDRIVREDIFEPLGMRNTWIGMPAEQFTIFGGFEGRIGPLYSTEKSPPAAKGMANSEAGCVLFRPGANARGPIGELARFYQMLLNGGELDGQRILSASMVEQLTARSRVGMFDETFKHVIDWGLGVIVNSRRYGDAGLPYGFGPHASDNTFGHAGNQSSCGLADPDRHLVVTWACNGMPGEPRHHARVQAINAAIYADLGIKD